VANGNDLPLLSRLHSSRDSAPPAIRTLSSCLSQHPLFFPGRRYFPLLCLGHSSRTQHPSRYLGVGRAGSCCGVIWCRRWTTSVTRRLNSRIACVNTTTFSAPSFTDGGVKQTLEVKNRGYGFLIPIGKILTQHEEKNDVRAEALLNFFFTDC
jgi:hypothetical protein